MPRLGLWLTIAQNPMPSCMVNYALEAVVVFAVRIPFRRCVLRFLLFMLHAALYSRGRSREVVETPAGRGKGVGKHNPEWKERSAALSITPSFSAHDQ